MRALLAIPLLGLGLAVVACTGAVPPAAGSRAAAPVACHPDATGAARPGPELEAACRQDPACGCATLGHALLASSDGAIEARALEALDGACHRGVAASCDEVAMVEELCVRGTARPSPACDVLVREGRLAGVAEMQAR